MSTSAYITHNLWGRFVIYKNGAVLSLGLKETVCVHGTQQALHKWCRDKWLCLDGQEWTSLGSLSSTGTVTWFYVPPYGSQNKNKNLQVPQPSWEKDLLYSFTPCKSIMERLLSEGAVQGGVFFLLVFLDWRHIVISPTPTRASHSAYHSDQSPAFFQFCNLSISLPLHGLFAMLFHVPGCAYPCSSHILPLLILQVSDRISHLLSLPWGACCNWVPLHDSYST